MNVKIPTFDLKLVPQGGFDGEALQTKPLTLNEAIAAIASDTTTTFACCFSGCTEHGTTDKMKNIDRDRVPERALTPLCPNHAQEMADEYQVGTFPLALTIKRVLEAFTARQRRATMGRHLLAPPAAAVRPSGNGTSGLRLATTGSGR